MSKEENEQTRLLREILKWIRFSGMHEAKNTLTSVLDTDAKRLIYFLSDGTRGTREIAKLAGIGSNKTVYDMWQDWLKLGLGEGIPVKRGSRFKWSFNLEDFGIEVPQIKKAQNKKENVAERSTEKIEVTKQSLEASYD